MKKLIYPTLLILAAFSCTSFMTHESTFLELINTKWISPITDNCFESLCFNSERTVEYHRCEDNLTYEIGYSLNGNNIEIEVYGESSLKSESKLILYEDNGVLRQRPNDSNTFPRNFIKVPAGRCN